MSNGDLLKWLLFCSLTMGLTLCADLSPSKEISRSDRSVGQLPHSHQELSVPSEVRVKRSRKFWGNLKRRKMKSLRQFVNRRFGSVSARARASSSRGRRSINIGASQPPAFATTPNELKGTILLVNIFPLILQPSIANTTDTEMGFPPVSVSQLESTSPSKSVVALVESVKGHTGRWRRQVQVSPQHELSPPNLLAMVQMLLQRLRNSRAIKAIKAMLGMPATESGAQAMAMHLRAGGQRMG